MEPIEGSETSAFKPQTTGKYPKENILHKEHGESLKSRQQSKNLQKIICESRMPYAVEILGEGGGVKRRQKITDEIQRGVCKKVLLISRSFVNDATDWGTG